MKPYVLLILFAIVVIAPLALRSGMQVSRETGSDVTGMGPLVIVTPHNQDIRREFARAFDEWHRQRYGEGVVIDYRVPGGTLDIKRVLQNTYNPHLGDDGTFAETLVPPYDMVWGGGDFFFDVELRNPLERNGKRISVLQPATIDPRLLAEAFPQPTLAGVKLYDYSTDAQGNVLPPTWVGVCLSSFGIVYNPDLYRVLDLPTPTTWHDLTHEKLSGLVALADPTRSGSAAVAYMIVIQRAMADAEEEYKKTFLTSLKEKGVRKVFQDDPAYQAAIAAGWKRGMGQLLLIAANARYFTDSASQVPNDVATGDAAAGVAIDFYGRVVQETVGDSRLQTITPAAATAITPDPIAILAGVEGDAYVLANRFIEFLLTPEAQRLWILKAGMPGGPRERSLRRTPVRQDVFADRANWADDVNPFAEAGGFNQRGAWMSLFGDTRPLWAAAWIDSREALKRAYAAILDVEDPSRRAALIAKLAELPIEMRDVANLRQERERIEKERGSAEEWKARQRIEWAKRFREHYARVAGEIR